MIDDKRDNKSKNDEIDGNDEIDINNINVKSDDNNK